MIVFALAALAGLGAAAMLNQSPERDEASLCRKDRPAQGARVILIDLSETLRAQEIRMLRDLIAEEARALAPEELFTLVVVNQDAPFEPDIVFSKCHPGAARHVNPMIANADLAQSRFAERFQAPLDRAAAGLEKRVRANRSPILESLSALGQEPAFAKKHGRRRLVVFSDMLQHAPGRYSHYDSASLQEAAFEAYRDQAPPPNLENSIVRVRYLLRPDALDKQTQAHREFWRRYFKDAGADAVTMDN